MRARFSSPLRALFVLISGTSLLVADPPPDWSDTLSRDSRGSFPDLRPGRASYTFSWSGVIAGSADVHFYRTDNETLTLDGRGRSVGLARALWRFDVDYRSVASAITLAPIETHQEENTRGKRVVTDLKFDRNGVTRTRIERNKPPSAKGFAAENLHDLHSALLYLRSQPLRERDTYRLAVYPATAGYLATITVVGHETINNRSGLHPAIKLDLKLQRIGKKGALEPYRKMKRLTAWISDDDDRMLLRLEGQIFIGTVTAELQSVRFD